MSSPWERYATSPEANSGPWARYGATLPDKPSQDAQTPQGHPQSQLPGVARAFIGLGAGLTQRAVGTIQAGADLLGAEGVSKAAGEVKRNIDRDVASLGGVGEAGRIIGDVAPIVAVPGGAATAAGRAGLGALAGAAEGATRASTDNRPTDRIYDAVTGAAIGAAIPAAFDGAGAIARGGKSLTQDVARGVRAKGGEAWADIGASLKARSNASYRAATEAGVVIKPEAVTRLADDIAAKLTKDGITDPELHKGTLNLLGRLDALKQSGQPLTLEGLDQIRQLVGDTVSRNTTKLEGANSDARKAVMVMEGLDDFVSRLGKSSLQSGDETATAQLVQARKEWGQFRRFDRVNQIVQQADGDANKVRNGLNRLLNDRKAMRNWSEAEKQALTRAAKETTTDKVLRGLGRFGFDTNNTFLPTVASGVGYAAGGVGGVGITAAGTAARHISKASQAGKAETLLSTLSQSAPEAAQTVTKTNGTLSRLPVAAAVVGGAAAAGAATSGNASIRPPQASREPPEAISAPFDVKTYTRNISKAEGHGKNPLSSAVGQGQYTAPSWMEKVQRYRPEWLEGRTKRQVLDLRKDRAFTGPILEEDSSDKAKLLEKAGLPVTPGNVYLAHFSGDTGAKKLLTADPRKLVPAVLSASAIKANPFLQGVRIRDLRKATEIAANTGRPLANILKNMRQS